MLFAGVVFVVAAFSVEELFLLILMSQELIHSQKTTDNGVHSVFKTSFLPKISTLVQKEQAIEMHLLIQLIYLVQLQLPNLDHNLLSLFNVPQAHFIFLF